MLMFSFAGQAMATFTSGDLIQVIYQSDGNGPEVAYDLGSFNGNITAISSDTSYGNTLSLSTLFPGKSMTDLSGGYFVYNIGSGNQGFWVTGADGGQTNVSGKKGTVNGAFNNVMNSYNTLSGAASQAVTTTGDANSYYSKLDKGGLGLGSFAGFLNSTYAAGAESTLPSSGYVDLYLYYYDYATANGSHPGVEIADIRTFADGHTEVLPLGGPSVPIPAAIWLLGSGLIGLVGIRRRETVA